MISAVVITKNEEAMIVDCLKSLSWADEILVIDTGNTDNTNKIAKKHGARIEEISGGSYAEWRNFGLKKASGEWILYVDADERIPKNLAAEVIESTKGQLIAYAIPRRNFVLGKELKYGGWYPDYQKRLFNKKYLKGWSGQLHEEPVIEGNLGHLKHSMLHYKHETFSQMVEKTNQWSEIEARLMFEANHPQMNIPRFLSAMFREFFHRMVAKRAFLDGMLGISFAMYQVFSKFVSYAKLWEMQVVNKS